jgi:hypothetical protein
MKSSHLILRPFFLVVIVQVIILAGVVAATEWILGVLDARRGALIEQTQLAKGVSTHQERFIQLRLHKPNTRTMYSPPPSYIERRTDSLEPKEYIAETDADGFFKPGLVHARADFLMAFLGGSTTENFFMAPEDRFASASARVIEHRTGLAVNSINASKSGNVSLHSLNNFVNVVLAYRPDVAIMLHNINDYAMLYHEGTYWNDHPDRSLLTSELVVNRSQADPLQGVQISTRRALLAIVDNALTVLTPRIASRLRRLYQDKSQTGATNGLDGDAQTIRWSKSKPFDIDRIADDFRRSLKSFIHVARAWGVEPVLMTMPARWPANLDNDTPRSVRNFMRRKAIASIDYSQFRAGFQRMNETILAVAEEEAVLAIDLAQVIPQTTEYLFDPVHLNGKGSRLAAEYIAQTLMDAGMHERRNPRSAAK